MSATLKSYNPPELVARAKTGDDDARDELVRKNMGLLMSLTALVVGFEKAEEYLSYAAVGYLRALDRFEPDRGIKFCTFGGNAAYWAVTSRRNAERKRKNVIHDVVPFLDFDLPATKDDTIADHENEEQLRVYLSILPERLGYVVESRLAGMKLHEIGEFLDLSKERVRQLHQFAVRLMAQAHQERLQERRRIA